MTSTPQGNLGVQLGERLMELGVTECLYHMPHRLEEVRTGKAVLVVVDGRPKPPKHRSPFKSQWGVARPDMPWKVFLKEVLP